MSQRCDIGSPRHTGCGGVSRRPSPGMARDDRLEGKALLISERMHRSPRDSEHFLAHHYGTDWRTPQQDWNFLEDDGCTKAVLT